MPLRIRVSLVGRMAGAAAIFLSITAVVMALLSLIGADLGLALLG